MYYSFVILRFGFQAGYKAIILLILIITIILTDASMILPKDVTLH